MRLNGKDRIITEDDINLSGSSLSERFASQQEQIDQLKSNVKWIYKYGGVGKGGGGGGSSSTAFSVYATLNGVQLKDQSIVLNGAGSYHLYIKINNPNNGAFNVKYSYTIANSSGHTTEQQSTQVLSIDNSYTLDTYITLNNNDALTIVATDGNDTKQVMCNYVTSPYSFNLGLVDDQQVFYTQEEIFITTASKKGLNVALQYTVSINAAVTYTYEFEGKTTTGEIKDRTGTIVFPIAKSLFAEENSGYYNAVLKLTVIPENQDPIELTYNKQFNLVPENLYVLLLPQTGHLYKEETELPELYKPGYITFTYRVYEGVPLGRTYTVKAFLNGQQVLNSSVLERDQSDFKIFSNTSGKNTLTIEVSGTTTYTATYYFYVDVNQIDLNWLDNSWSASYYRINEVTPEFESYKNQLYIEQTVNTPTIEFKGIETPNLSGTAIINTHVAIGLQYNAVNTGSATLLQFYNKNKNNAILEISQDQILRDGISKEIYIQKQEGANASTITNYHLLQIYSQYIKSIGNENYYSLSIYIDGKLEAEMPQLVNTPLLINSLKILPINCFINCIDVDYKEATASNNCDYEVYRYYLKYQNVILGNADIVEEAQLLPYLVNFHVGTNGRVEVDQQTINNVAANISTPSMMLVYENDSDEDFMAKLEKNYGEDGTGIGSDLNFPVTVQWSPGGKGLQVVQFPDEYIAAQFRAGLQGSSTKGFRGKNFFLEAENTLDSEQAEVYLFSPNFSNEDNSTFLPENRYNLKADVVDSSHSNNTTCGKFVNTVSKKFYTDTTNPYSSYVRNCLEGFPMLLYLNVIETDKNTGERLSKYYYLGIYNFNLGREAYFNLGYRDLSVFVNGNKKLLINAGDSFTFYKLTKEQDTNVKGLGVAEIQGGSPYFDFSQFDKSILFEQATSSAETKDITYMFGDLVRGSGSTDTDLQNAITNLVKNVALSGGYLFDFLKKNKGAYEDGYNAEKLVDGKPSGESLNQVPDYTTQYRRTLEAGGGSTFTPIAQEPIQGIRQNLVDLLIPDVDSGKKAILDYQSLAEYYTICMVLGLVDSVMKNLNIKTWNLYTWYLAFYDMDTCLGLNNAGNDISYFAFSDYWYGAKTTINHIDYPEKTTVYRDFSPKLLGDAGYDIPSSYLFAVAKYARLILGSEDYNAYMSIYPQELYAKWRSNTVNNATNEGILKNADYFMEHFFSNNIGSISGALVSYNYRAKYLSLGSEKSTVWVNNDYIKFHGTRINKVRDWLNGRLHILDVYFNLNRQMVGAFSYLDKGQWQTLKIGETAVSDLTYKGNYNISTNPDVIILHDIFSEDTSSAGIQLSVDTSFTIRCPEYSPLQICSANNAIQYNYILGGENLQNIKFKTSGNQSVKLGGSQSWTYLESINWISTSGNLFINSDNLETIYGDDGTFAGIELRTPNARTISLNSSKYTGQLKLKDSVNFPNLNSIDISNSRLSLDVNKLNVATINVSNIRNNSASISIANCSKIEKFICNNVNIQSLQFLNIPTKVKDITLSKNAIASINMSCDAPNGSITISNDNTLQEVTLSGFKTISIANCPKLKKVTFTQTSTQPINGISITNCQNKVMAITSTADTLDGYADFTNITTLQTLKLTNTISIQHLKLPPNITLPSYACKGVSNLLTVTGTNIQLAGTDIFADCNQYGLRAEDGSYTDLHTIVQDVSGLFKYNNVSTAITIKDAQHFIDKCLSADVVCINYLFYGNTGLVYGLNEFKSDLSEGTKQYIDLSKLVNVNSAAFMFSKCKIQALNKNMLNFGGKWLDLNGFIDPIPDETDNYIYVTLDSLNNIITKVVNLFGTYEDNDHKYIFLDSTGEQIVDEIKLKDFFSPNNKIPTQLKSLFRFCLNTEQTFDLSNLFTSSWTSLISVDRFLWTDNQKYKGIDKLFYYLPKLKQLGWVLKPSTITEERTDLYTILNWDQFITINGGNIQAGNWRFQTFNFYKYISLEDYTKLCNTIIKSKVNNIANLFHNCNIIGFTDNLTFGSTSIVNDTITDCCYAFRNCKLFNGAIEIPIPLSATFFKNFSNVQLVSYMFSSTYLKNPIPFNFFNKRIEDNTIDRNVYVKINNEYKPAYLTIYDYKHDITDFRMLFYNTKWLATSTQYNPSLYSIPKNRVEYNGQTYDTYYRKITHVDEDNEVYFTYEEEQITQNTEITDATEIKGYYISQARYNEKGESYKNFSLNADNQVNALCIPPDLFYGVSQTGSVEYQYALNCATSLQGVIPPNIFKYNRGGTVNNTFKDQHIIPNLVKTYSEEGKTINAYSHFPSKYTTSTKLSDAFNCQAIIPVNDSKTTNWVFMILKDSIPQKVTNLDRAFYIKWNDYYYNGQEKEDQNYINYVGNVTTGSIIEGFDLEYYDQLNIDKMLYSHLNSFIYGRLFTSTSNISNASLFDINSKVFGNIGVVNHFTSQYIQFPQASGYIPYFFDFTVTDKNIKASQIPTASRQWYEQTGLIIND